jgi:hypothetical protein
MSVVSCLPVAAVSASGPHGRNFYKVETWTDDELHVQRMLYAGSSLGKAKVILADAVRKRPRGHYTIRQRIRVLDKWPK